MIDERDLLQFYTVEYQREAKKKTGYLRAGGYEKRIRALKRTLSRAGAHQVSRSILEDYHRQIKNLVHITTRYKNKSAFLAIFDQILPELIRLDIGLLLPEDRACLDGGFLDYVEKNLPGGVCTKTLFELCQSYRRYCIENRITELVPSRPQLEFPEALAMSRRFILHIGPTNSGKTFQALERLKTARNGVYLGPLRLLALEVYEKMKDYGTPCTTLTGQECIEMPESRVTASTVEMADLANGMILP